MKDFQIDPIKKDYTVTGGQYALTDSLRNNIYLSLSIRKGSWAFAPGFGSKLHLLEREKALNRTTIKATEYCKEALQWIIDKGRAEKIEVIAVLDKENTRINCLIEATQKGKPIIYEHFVEVR